MSSIECSVWVGNIPYDITESQLKKFLTKAGEVIKIKFLYDNNSTRHKGQAICQFAKVQMAESALRNLDKAEFSGRLINVKPSKLDINSTKFNKNSEKNSIPIDNEIKELGKLFTKVEKKEILREFLNLKKLSYLDSKRLLDRNPIFVQFILSLLQDFDLLDSKDNFYLFRRDFLPKRISLRRRKCIIYLTNIPMKITENDLHQNISNLLKPNIQFDIKMVSPNSKRGKIDCAVLEFEKAKEAKIFFEKHESLLISGSEIFLDYSHNNERELNNNFGNFKNNFSYNENNNNMERINRMNSLRNQIYDEEEFEDEIEKGYLNQNENYFEKEEKIEFNKKDSKFGNNHFGQRFGNHYEDKKDKEKSKMKQKKFENKIRKNFDENYEESEEEVNKMGLNEEELSKELLDKVKNLSAEEISMLDEEKREELERLAKLLEN